MLQILIALSSAFQAPATVTVRIDGPQESVRFECELPCEVERFTELETRSVVDRSESEGDTGSGDRGRQKCLSDCDDGSRKVIFSITPKKTLREGYRFELDAERGTLIFYDVVDDADGERQGRQRISDFHFDRSPLVFEAHGHTVDVRAAAP